MSLVLDYQNPEVIREIPLQGTLIEFPAIEANKARLAAVHGIYDNYTEGVFVSNGGFGRVYKAYSQKDKNPVAIKVWFPNQWANMSDEDQEYWMNDFYEEQNTLARHSKIPGIVNYKDHGIVYVPNPQNIEELIGVPFTVMDFIDGVGLDSYGRNPYTSFSNKLSAFREALTTVSMLHRDGNAVHRDLKLSAFIVRKDLAYSTFRKKKTVLIDLGTVKRLEDTNQDLYGAFTPGFAPPELLSKTEPYSESGDRFEMGITALGLLYGLTSERILEITKWGRRQFYYDENIYNSIKHNINELRLSDRGLILRSITDKISDFIITAINPNPLARFTSDQEMQEKLENIFQHPVLQLLRKEPPTDSSVSDANIFDFSSELNKISLLPRESISLPLVLDAFNISTRTLGTMVRYTESNTENNKLNPHSFNNFIVNLDKLIYHNSNGSFLDYAEPTFMAKYLELLQKIRNYPLDRKTSLLIDHHRHDIFLHLQRKQGKF